MSIFKKCLERKEKTKEDHIRHGKSLSRIILVHHGMPKSSWSIFIRPKGSHGNMIKSLIQVIPRATKGKGPKCTIHSQWPTESCSPYWSKTIGFLSFSQDQEEFHIRKDTILMPYVSTKGELEFHITENCTIFKDKVQSLIYANPIKFRELVSGHQKH